MSDTPMSHWIHWPDGQIRPEDPYRCGTFVARTGEGCTKWSDHEGECTFASDARPSPSGEPPTGSDTRILCAVCGIWQCLARHGGGTCHAVNGPADVSCGACYANRPAASPVASPSGEPPADAWRCALCGAFNSIDLTSCGACEPPACTPECDGCRRGLPLNGRREHWYNTGLTMDGQVRVACTAAVASPLPEEPPTEQRIAEIQSRMDRATTGPWSHVVIWQDDSQRAAIRGGLVASCGTDNGNAKHYIVPAAWGEWKSSGAAHDAEFIAHANADIAYLLAERSRLAGENAELLAKLAAREKADG